MDDDFRDMKKESVDETLRQLADGLENCQYVVGHATSGFDITQEEYRRLIRGLRWARRFLTIELRYAEYTGGHMNAEDMLKVLSEECFQGE